MSSTEKLGVIIPAYWPLNMQRSWTLLLTTMYAFKDVPVTIILPRQAAFDAGHNTIDAQIWRSMIRTYSDHGATVLGRIDTNFAEYGTEVLQAQVMIWKSAFGEANMLDGIMYDRMSNQEAHIEYYQKLSRFVIENSQFSVTMGNVGRPVSRRYLTSGEGAAGSFIIKDSAGLDPVDSMYQQYYADVPSARNRLAVMAHSVPVYNPAWVAQITQFVAWVYVTNGDGSYNSGLPNYFYDLMFHLSELQRSRGSS